MAAEGDGSYTETTQIDSDNIKLKEVERPRIKKYFNQGGNFITGVDITSKEAAEKRDKRLQRFGHTPPKTPSEVAFSLDKLQERAQRFGIQAPVVKGEVVKCLKELPNIPEGVLRDEAVLVHGTNDMSTKDVLAYFSLYGPSFLEWIDDASCNAVWEDPASALRALQGKGQYPVILEDDKDKLSSGEIQPVWRLGEPHPKAKRLLLRFATSSDVKKPGSASRSLYYQKHGNTNLQKHGNTSLQSFKFKRKKNEKKVKSTWREEDLRSRLSRKRSSQKLEASAGEDTEEIEEMEEDNEGSEYEDEDMEFENESARIPSLVSIPKRAREDLNSSLGKMRSNLDTTDMRKNNDLRSKITLGKTGVLVSRLGKQT